MSDRNILWTDLSWGRVHKDDIRIQLMGDLDELSAYTGILTNELDLNKNCCSNQYFDFAEFLRTVQYTNYIISSSIYNSDYMVPIDIGYFEKTLSSFKSYVRELNKFIYYGGSSVSTKLFYARALTRRIERNFVHAMADGHIDFNKDIIRYLNLLSSIFFYMARFFNEEFHRLPIDLV
jgi:ATP:cob(I)alamin adenosyltransferase